MLQRLAMFFELIGGWKSYSSGRGRLNPETQETPVFVHRTIWLWGLVDCIKYHNQFRKEDIYYVCFVPLRWVAMRIFGEEYIYVQTLADFLDKAQGGEINEKNIHRVKFFKLSF